MPHQITLNGKPESVEEGATVASLLQSRGVNPARVAVELNRRILRREEYDTTTLASGDALEVVTFVGGG
ncbi:MAG: sulfur carrier protein ThiS [Sphingomonadaceae bacterium]